MNKFDYVIGVDPDSKGALTSILSNGESGFTRSVKEHEEWFPLFLDLFSNLFGTSPGNYSTSALGLNKPKLLFIVEQQVFMPKRRGIQNHLINYGKLVGLLQGIFSTYPDNVVVEVHPSTWANALFPDKNDKRSNKEKSLKFAQEFIPVPMTGKRILKPNQAVADSFCLAYWGWQRIDLFWNQLAKSKINPN